MEYNEPLHAPFPWFGGKSRIAPDVWARFGDVINFVEPFAGSLAVLLGRPAAHLMVPRVETINDKDAHLANFWRAIQFAPDAVAQYASWPVNEVDLHARHLWLVTTGAERIARLTRDPLYYDPQVAGWWVWGLCAWIAAGWCQIRDRTRIPRQRLPHLSSLGMGVHRPDAHTDMWAGLEMTLPHSIPHLGGNRGVLRHRAEILDTFRQLSDRLRRVRVTCGDWTRVMGDSVTWRHGTTGVFLDPPYALHERSRVYAVDEDVSVAVREWAIAHGSNPLLRIALCGYEGEHHMPSSWTCLAWKAIGGYGSRGEGRGRTNAARERVWFSPHCLSVERMQGELFDEAYADLRRTA